jgi:hypothetical protein
LKAAAVICSNGILPGVALAAQAKLHKPWGGVVPGLEEEAHKVVIGCGVQ